MRTALVVALLAVAVLLAACGSGDTLTDEQLLWCADNYDEASRRGPKWE